MYRRFQPSLDIMCDFQERLEKIVSSPLPHKEPMSDLLPRPLESIPSGYRSLSTSQVTHSLTSPVKRSIVPNPYQPPNLFTTIQNPGSSDVSPVSSCTRWKPPT